MTSIAHVPGHRRFGWYRPRPQGGLDLHIIARPLDEDNWTEFREHTRVVEFIRPYIIDYLALVSDFEAVTGVEVEVSAALTDVLAQVMITVVTGVEANARAQQLASNFLSAASAFRDRAASRLSRQFGSVSAETQALKAATSRLFDRSFAYRALYALRNYAQHHEVPVSLVPISANRSAEGAMICQIGLHLDPRTLAASGKINAKLHAELTAIGARQLALLPLLDEFMAAHQEIMAEVLRIYSTDLAEMAHYAAALYRTFEIPHDVVPVVWEGDDPAAGPETQKRCIMCGFDEMLRAFALRDQLQAAIVSTTYRNDSAHAVV